MPTDRFVIAESVFAVSMLFMLIKKRTKKTFRL